MIAYEKRVASLEAEIKNRRIDSFLVTNETNVSYLTGFEGKDSLLLIALDKRYFITDSRYIEEAEGLVRGFSMALVESSTYETLKDLIKKNNLKRIGFESMNLPYEVANRLSELIGRRHLIPIKGLIETLRSIKDATETVLIKEAAKLTRTILNKILKKIKPGLSEKSLSREIEVEFINAGSEPSFTPIVASGKNSSKPHAKPTDSKLPDDSFVMIDLGCNLNGYNSDCTRMLLFGRIKKRFKKIYEIVYEAQGRALKKVKAGNEISEVDLAARRYIKGQGFGKYFGHSLGHGVGMDLHEEPTVSKTNHDLLKPGMVFTIEPAIYIPKFGGARIEDMVLVTNNGYEVLTR